MGFGSKIKSALNGDKTRDGPRRKDTVNSKAPTPPAKTPVTTPPQVSGAFPSEEAPRAVASTTNAADVNAAWNEPKPTHVAQPHSTLRSPSPDYTFRTAESDVGFNDDVSQLSEDFNERTSIGERADTPTGAHQHNRLSKDPNSKYPYWGAAGTGTTNGANTATTAARTAMAGTDNNSPRSAHTATMNSPSPAAVGRSDGHVKFNTAPQRHVGEQDIYTGGGPTDSTYGELGNAGYDTPISTPRGVGSLGAPPIPDKIPGRTFTGNDNYNANGYAGASTGTGLGMTSSTHQEPVIDRETNIAEYGAPTNSDSRRQASTSTRGLAAAAMARRHRDDDMREYETSTPQHGYTNSHTQGHYSQAQPHSINTDAYTRQDNHAPGSGMPLSHERGTGVTSPTNHLRHSPKDSGFGSGDDYSPASAPTQLKMMTGMGDGHFGPGHPGAKVVHRCHNCGVDNDISRYFSKEVVYRLGD